MIANFKQWDSFWNNFNNGDEALFQDASLPRDTFWFKIKNWIQTQQQDLRTSSSWIVEYFSVCWWKEITWVAQNQMNYWTSVNIPLYTNVKWKFSASQTYPYTMEQEEGLCNTEKMGSLGWWVRNWRVYIPADWIYFIQYICEFLWQISVTTPDATQAPKLHVQLWYFDTKWNKVWALDNADAWWIINPDSVSWITLQLLKWGESIWIDAIHWRNWIKSFCRWILKIQKLS